MEPGLIEEKDMEHVRLALGQGIQEVLKALGIGCRQLQEEAIPGVRFYRTLYPEALMLVLPQPDGLDSFERDSATLRRNQAYPGFIFEIHLHLRVGGLLGDRRLKVDAEVFFNAATACSSCLGLRGRATLAVAPSL